MDPEVEARMIENARHRDETEAYLLGNHTPVEKMLDQANLRESLFLEMAKFVAAVANCHEINDDLYEELYARAIRLDYRYRSL